MYSEPDPTFSHDQQYRRLVFQQYLSRAIQINKAPLRDGFTEVAQNSWALRKLVRNERKCYSRNSPNRHPIFTEVDKFPEDGNCI